MILVFEHFLLFKLLLLLANYYEVCRFMEITKFFNTNKRDLTSKSNDGDDLKRSREFSLDDSIANATNKDVFTESLKSEDFVATLYSRMKKLEEKFVRCVKIQKVVKLKVKPS